MKARLSESKIKIKFRVELVTYKVAFTDSHKHILIVYDFTFYY